MARKIRDQVQSNMPETYAVLTAKYDGDGEPDLVALKVADALAHCFPGEADPDEATLITTDFQAQYVGDYATHLLIPTAIEYYAVRTGRQDSIAGLPDGQDGRSVRGAGPGTGRIQYDRVQVLKDLDAMLLARLAANEDQFNGTTGATSAGLVIDSSPDDLRTVDPQTMQPIYWGVRRGLPRVPPYSWPDDTADPFEQLVPDADATTT